MNTKLTIVRPMDVVSISTPRPKEHRRSWILLAARDDEFDVCIAHISDVNGVFVTDTILGLGYRDLWKSLKCYARGKASTWALIFRARHALEKSNWIGALESGEIKLERQLRKAGKQAGAGKIGLTQDFLEVDLRIGSRKIKLLDWTNFGVDLIDHELSANTYTITDVIKVFEGWIKSLNRVCLTASHTSAAQIGWSKLRRSVRQLSIHTSLQPEIRALERRCYYGGRVEAYRLGRVDGRCHQMDIRSCYAAICATQELPIEPVQYCPDGMSLDDARSASNFTFAADCVVKTDVPMYPVRDNGRTIYPTGEFFTSLCGNEFFVAIESGHVKKITRCAIYIRAGVLTDYAEWYLRARDSLGTAGLNNFVGALKATFNSSLGFFARQGREWLPWAPAGSPPWWFGVTEAPGPPGGVVRAHTIGGASEWLSIGSEPRNASPILHGVITSMARTKLMMLMLTAAPKNVIYCDTDGLIVNQAGYDNLIAENKINGQGAGTISERAQGDHCVINSLKNYRIGNKITCAGMLREHHRQWEPNVKFDVKHGVLHNDGRVTPFVMRVENRGGDESRYVNEIVVDTPDKIT